jgi:Ca2+-binding EF-hand superfamily protein
LKKNGVELEKLRKEALAMIFHHQGAKKLTSEEVFAAFDIKKSGKVNESSFVSFFKTCEKKEVEGDDKTSSLSEDDAQRLFSSLDTEDADFLSKEQFLSFIRKLMKVVKASVLTEEISVKSTSLRRIEEGEVLDILTGPTSSEDGDEAIDRLKVKAMSDGVEGWVTPVGNQGTVFLQDGGDKFKVVKETILTGSFVIGEETETKDRKLQVGQTVDVQEWAKKEEASGLMRMKVRASDGQVGFVTSVGNTGIAFLEVV